MHTILPLLLAMVAIIVLLNMLASKLKVAYPILLVLGGLAISFVPGLPLIKVNPDLIFFIFLPPLLFEACWSASFKEMKKYWRMISSFAFLVVFFTALSVALVTNHFIPGFSIALGFLLGGIVSPPDAVSTGAITKFVKIPKSTSAILEGESLLNDASSLIIFRFALVAVGTGQFIWQTAALSFIWMIIGGVAVGVVVAWLFVQAHKKLPTDASSDIALTLVEPYLMYWLAEQMHASGVLAVVAGGLFMSARRLEFLNSASRIRGYSVWESFVFILNGLVFLIIGLDLPEIIEGIRAHGTPISKAIGYGVLVTIVLIVARIISAYASLIATRIFRPSVLPKIRSKKRMMLLPLMLGWTGMRGVVSLAAALAIPVTLDNGEAFPQRSLILFITFVAILLTLVVQGLTLPYIINKWGLFDDYSNDELEEKTKMEMKSGLRKHVLEFVKEKCANDENPNSGIQLFMRQWEERTKASQTNLMDNRTKEIFMEILEVQRQYLAKLNKDPNIDEEVIRQQLYQLDLEEERLKII